MFTLRLVIDLWGTEIHSASGGVGRVYDCFWNRNLTDQLKADHINLPKVNHIKMDDLTITTCRCFSAHNIVVTVERYY